MNENYIIKKSNYFIMNSSYDLSLQEQKIILTLASMVQPDDKEFKPYVFSIAEFMNLIEVDTKTKYTDIPKITKELMKKVFEIKQDGTIIQTAWLAGAKYMKGSGYVELIFSPYLKPYMLQLNTMFTQYKLMNILSMKSKYSSRIYELLKCNEFKKQGFIIIDVSELRHLLKAVNIYPLYADFKKKIILPAQRELKKLTDISFDFEEIKTGRKITALKFYICLNQTIEEIKQEQPSTPLVDTEPIPEVIPAVQAVEATPEPVIDIDDLADSLRAFIKEPLKTKELKEILEISSYNIDIIMNKYAIYQIHDDIDNLKDWLIWAIKTDYKEPVKDIDDLCDELRTIIVEPLSTKDLKAILSASNNDIKLIKSKYAVAKKQGNIKNITAFLIAAIKKDFSEPVSIKENAKKQTNKNRFINYQQRSWDFEELAKMDYEYMIKNLKRNEGIGTN